MEKLKEKTSQLETLLQESGAKIVAKERCMPTMMIAGMIVPLAVLLVLFFLQPSFVQKKEGKKSIRDGKKIFFYTVGITIMAWLAMYLYTWCRGYSTASMVCSR
jgi:hypothetical protein